MSNSVIKFSLSAIVLAFSCALAGAHAGHVDAMSGHNHWLSYAAAGAAVLILVSGLFLSHRSQIKAKR